MVAFEINGSAAAPSFITELVSDGKQRGSHEIPLVNSFIFEPIRSITIPIRACVKVNTCSLVLVRQKYGLYLYRFIVGIHGGMRSVNSTYNLNGRKAVSLRMEGS